MPYSDDANSKYCLKKSGTRYTFSIKDPQPEDAGFYQVDVDDTNVLTTDFQGKENYYHIIYQRYIIVLSGFLYYNIKNK